jgi:hypothetical protein
MRDPSDGILDARAPVPAYRDATISALAANAIGFGVFLAAGVVCVPVFLAVWDGTAFLRGALRFVRLSELIPLFLVLIVVHELLHAAGFAWIARVPRTAIRFGVQWKTLTPYAHCRVPVAAFQYRAAVALPGLLLGIVPCIIALAIGSGWLLIWGILMTMAAGGDVAILWAIRSAPSSAEILDHPDKGGCLIALPDPQEPSPSQHPGSSVP